MAKSNWRLFAGLRLLDQSAEEMACNRLVNDQLVCTTHDFKKKVHCLIETAS